MVKEAETISKKLSEIGPKVKENLSEISHSMELSDQEINDFVNSFLSEDISRDIAMISFRFVPKRDQVTQQVLELSKNAPLQFMMPKALLGEDGRTVAEIGNLEEDLEGNVIHQISQNLSIQSFFLNQILDKMKVHHNLDADTLLEILMQSPLFDEEKKQILQNGLEMYFKENFIAAIHILIPQIENAFRRMIYLSGGATLKPSNNHGGV